MTCHVTWQDNPLRVTVNPKDISYYQIELDLEGLAHRQELSPLAMVKEEEQQQRERFNKTIVLSAPSCSLHQPRLTCPLKEGPVTEPRGTSAPSQRGLRPTGAPGRDKK